MNARQAGGDARSGQKARLRASDAWTPCYWAWPWAICRRRTTPRCSSICPGRPRSRPAIKVMVEWYNIYTRDPRSKDESIYEPTVENQTTLLHWARGTPVTMAPGPPSAPTGRPHVLRACAAPALLIPAPCWSFPHPKSRQIAVSLQIVQARLQAPSSARRTSAADAPRKTWRELPPKILKTTLTPTASRSPRVHRGGSTSRHSLHQQDPARARHRRSAVQVGTHAEAP